MAFLSSRFDFDASRGGSESHDKKPKLTPAKAPTPRSFRQRQKIDKNRHTIGAYREAGVVHNYKANARAVINDAKTVSSPTEGAYDKPAHTRTSRVDESERPSSRVRRPRRSSRIDVVTSNHPSDLSRPIVVPRGIGAKQAQVKTAKKVAFKEPVSRRMNPFR